MKSIYTFCSLYLLLILTKVGGSESCSRTVGCEVTRRNDNTIYFGLMLSYPDPLGRIDLASDFDDGHDIAPAAYLAVEQINNRSDLLSDYRVKLLPLDGGCTVTERTVVGINNLACSSKPVVGIVGPSCGTSALIVGEFTRKEQFSIVTIHYGERNILGNREMFPFAFGMLGANFITIQAFTKLIIRNNWSKIVLLYSEVDLDLNEVSAGIEKNIRDTPGFATAFTSPIYDRFIPLHEIKQSLTRIIFVFLSVEATLRTLCLAFHEGMIFPKYQWVFKERFENDFTEIGFTYEGKLYFCTEEDIRIILHGSINLVWSLGSADGTIDNSLISAEYEEGYKEQRNLYVNEYNVSSMPVEWARGIYDAVWSLAFALNRSLSELNMNMTQITTGSNVLAQTIANHMSEIDFQGISGKIDFDRETGFNTARQVNIYQFGAAKSTKHIGFYATKELVIFNDTPSQFINATFDMKRENVSIALAVPFLIITIAVLLFAVPIQIINIIYRNHSSIKATSPNLNHLIFIGCYLTVIGMALTIIIEILKNTHKHPLKSSLCNAVQCFTNVGTSMIIGTACLKTWRLYRIYISSKRVLRLSPKALTDPVLGLAVGGLALVDLLICVLWTGVDPMQPTVGTRMETPQKSELPVIITTVICQSKWEVYWVGMLLGYKYILIGCSTVLAMLTKIKKEEFQTRNIVILAYLFAITYGLGIPIYTMLVIIGVHVSVLFTITCVVINTIMYSCLFMLFLPSVIPLIRGKITEVKYIVWQ